MRSDHGHTAFVFIAQRCLQRHTPLLVSAQAVRAQAVLRKATELLCQRHCLRQSLAIEQGAYFEGKSRRTDDPLSTKADKPVQADKPRTEASAAGTGTPRAAE